MLTSPGRGVYNRNEINLRFFGERGPRVKEYLDISRTNMDFGDALFTIHHFHWHNASHSDKAVVSHSHQYYELHLVVRGEGVIDFGGESVVLSPGEAVVVGPGREHLPIRITGDGAENLTLAFSVRQIPGEAGAFAYFTGTLLALTEELTVFTPPAALTADLRLISRMSETGSLRDYCYVKTVCCRAVFLLFDHINQFRGDRQSRADRQFRGDRQSRSDIPVRQAGAAEPPDRESLSILLENLLNEPGIPLSQIARRLGFSERQTQRLIRNQYGKSFRAVRQDMQFSTACRILRESPSLPLKEVAARAGFTSPACRTRCS